MLQSAVNQQGGGIGWAVGTYADGSFEKGVKECFTNANGFLTPLSKSWKNSIASKSFPTNAKTSIGDLSGGFSATESRDGKSTYLQMFKLPSSGRLDLPSAADGKKFGRARLLKSGKTTSLSKVGSGYSLALPIGLDPTDSVIELRN